MPRRLTWTTALPRLRVMEDRDYEVLLDRLADYYGIDAEYHDIYGQRHVVGADTKRRLLAAMGVSVESRDAIAHALQARLDRWWTDACDPVLVRRIGDVGTWSFRMPAAEGEEQSIRIEWAIDEESAGRVGNGQYGPGVQATEADCV